MGQNTNSIITAIMQGNHALTSQICNCCCDMKQLVTAQGYENRLANCENMNTLTRTMEGNTRSLTDAYREGFQSLLAKMDASEARRQQVVHRHPLQIVVGRSLFRYSDLFHM